jgi:hypothetical protein
MRYSPDREGDEAGICPETVGDGLASGSSSSTTLRHLVARHPMHRPGSQKWFADARRREVDDGAWRGSPEETESRAEIRDRFPNTCGVLLSSILVGHKAVGAASLPFDSRFIETRDLPAPPIEVVGARLPPPGVMTSLSFDAHLPQGAMASLAAHSASRAVG